MCLVLSTEYVFERLKLQVCFETPILKFQEIKVCFGHYIFFTDFLNTPLSTQSKTGHLGEASKQNPANNSITACFVQ